MRKLINFFRGLMGMSMIPKPPCDCHGCMPVPTNDSRSPYVSHGLHMWVVDGKIHYRKKSTIRDTF